MRPSQTNPEPSPGPSAFWQKGLLERLGEIREDLEELWGGLWELLGELGEGLENL